VENLRHRVRNDWWVAVVLVVSLVGTLKRDEQGFAEPTVVTGLLILVAVLPLLWRRTKPEVTLLVTAVAVAVYFAATYADGPVYLSIFLAVWALARRRPVPQWLSWAAVALAVIVTGLVVREIRVDENSTLGTVGWITWFVTAFCAAAAVGTAVRTRSETHAEQVRRTATEEQLRMAQDLHDGVGHGLAVIAMQAGVALHVLDTDPAGARRSLEAIRDTSKESLDMLRAELVRLSPITGDAAPRSPRNRLRQLEALADRVRAGGLPVTLVVDPGVVDSGALPDAVEEVAYSVVQEALTNVLRHASAATARVDVRRTAGGIALTVTDDGRGVATGRQVQGMGISGMRSRVESLGGTLDVGPSPERGFRVHAVLPLQDGPR
jgi:signal transduction histidine kinase